MHNENKFVHFCSKHPQIKIHDARIIKLKGFSNLLFLGLFYRHKQVFIDHGGEIR